MINLETETLISLHQAAEMLPPQPGGRATHVAKLVRAIANNDLEGLKFGGQWCTSYEALQRWGIRGVQRYTARHGPPEAPRPLLMPKVPKGGTLAERHSMTQRRLEIDRAARELKEMGFRVEPEAESQLS